LEEKRKEINRENRIWKKIIPSFFPFLFFLGSKAKANRKSRNHSINKKTARFLEKHSVSIFFSQISKNKFCTKNQPVVNGF
jgi:ATP-dependent Zn protease